MKAFESLSDGEALQLHDIARIMVVYLSCKCSAQTVLAVMAATAGLITFQKPYIHPSIHL